MWGAIISGLIGAAGSVFSASKTSGAAKDSANAASANANSAIGLQREAAQRTETELRPYATAGTDSLEVARGLLGLGPTSASTTAQPSPEARAAASAPDWNAYLAANPDVGAFYAKNQGAIAKKYGINGINDFAQWHYDNYGKAEGRAAPPTAGAKPPASSASAAAPNLVALGNGAYGPTSGGSQRITVEPGAGAAPAAGGGFGGSIFGNLEGDAAASFADSPWYGFADTASKDAVNDLDSRYGASGMLLSGQAVGARAEIMNRLKGDAFDKHYNATSGAKIDYLNSVLGLTGQGMNAASGIGSGGANFANQAQNALTNASLIRSQANSDAAEAQGNAAADIAGFGGWALGGLSKPKSGGVPPIQPRSITPISNNNPNIRLAS